MATPTLTVSLPTFNCPDVHRAAKSVLDQSFRDLVLVVVNDGGETPELPRDPRLVYFPLAVNRGRYYADAVTLRACQTEWFTVHDADDWSETSRYEHMFTLANGHQVIAGGLLNYDLKNSFRHPAPPKRIGDRSRIEHLWHMAALYRTADIQGLIAPGFRVGYDTLLANILSVSADMGFDDALLYHRIRRLGSLTTDPLTRPGSQLRRQEAAKLLSMWRLFRTHTLEAARDMVRRRTPPDLWEQVEVDAERLRRLL